ncbi:MAG: lysophospholipid acyltransferase family protein [Bacteroidota bacterium]
MSKSKFKISDWLQYGLVKILFFLVKIIPFSWSRWILKEICLLAFHILKPRRLLTIENIRNAREKGFLDKGTNDYKLAREAWKHLGDIGSEFLYYYTRTPEQLRKYVTIEGEDNLRRVLAKKKGVIMVMGHIGNWELLGMALSIAGYKLSPIVKPQANSLFDKIIQEKRHSIGMKTISSQGFLRPVVAAFKRNEIVPFLIDQDEGGGGIKVDFFGRKASIPPGAAEFSLRTDTPVIFAYITKKSCNHHVLVISEEIQIKNSGDYKKDLVDNTALFISLIQNAVRQNPSQWLWMHSLWPTNIQL